MGKVSGKAKGRESKRGWWVFPCEMLSPCFAWKIRGRASLQVSLPSRISRAWRKEKSIRIMKNAEEASVMLKKKPKSIEGDEKKVKRVQKK